MKRLLFVAVAFSFFLFPFSNPLRAQERFDVSVMGGLNFCQIDGDDAGSYSHLGLRAGVGTSFFFGWDERTPWRMVVELAFSQKGSRIVRDDFQRTISLNYVELPIMMSYTLLDRRLRLAAGVAPAVQVGASVLDYGGEHNAAHEANYKRFDYLPLVASARYLFTDNLGFELRFQTSMLSITEQNAHPAYRIVTSNTGSFNRAISAGLSYTF